MYAPKPVPLVTVIIPSRHSGRTIGGCLVSLAQQTFRDFEVVVVDNRSTDETREIARGYGAKVIQRGDERSAQRNHGLKIARGHYVFFVDSDMYLSPRTLETVVGLLGRGADAVIVPETSVGQGFWARCRWLERRCYEQEAGIEAARCFRRDALLSLSGYDEELVAFEDWDLHQRYIGAGYSVARADRDDALIEHDEGRLTLRHIARKRRYYAGSFASYARKHRSSAQRQLSVATRLAVYLRHWPLLKRYPSLTVGMLVMKAVEALHFYASTSVNLKSPHPDNVYVPDVAKRLRRKRHA